MDSFDIVCYLPKACCVICYLLSAWLWRGFALVSVILFIMERYRVEFILVFIHFYLFIIQSHEPAKTMLEK